MFIDHARIHLKAGNGGNGAVSFHREKYIAAGGPDGGDGGKGGDIIFVVDEGVRTLADFRYKRHYKAENGQDGGPSNCTGRSGEDLIIKVPAGTIVKDEETGAILADLTKPGQREIIVKGGKGGKGNHHFATPTRQVPSFAKAGDTGEERWVILELKLLADVGLIGYPNAGKSTFLSSVTAARPKIANYPFTTIEPNLGVVATEDGRSFVLADIPGLIEGAHQGVGLGHEFLKHVERTKLLIHVVDVAGTEGRNPIDDFEIINNELKQYSENLISRPQVVAANKIDVIDDYNKLEEFTKYVEGKGYKVFPVSAATKHGVRELIYHVSDLLDKLPETKVAEVSKEIVYKLEEKEPFTVRREGDIYIVEGEWIRKVVASTNFNNYESMQYFHRSLKRKGVVEELERQGIKEGDTVKIYEIEFEYVP